MDECKHDWNYNVRPIVCKKCGKEYQYVKIEGETVIYSEGYIVIKKVIDQWGCWIGLEITTPEASHTAVEIRGATAMTSQRVVSLRPDKNVIFIETWDTMG